MKHFKIILLGLLALCPFSARCDYSHYVGTDVQSALYKYNKSKHKFSQSMNVFSGIMLNDTVGLEVGGYRSSKLSLHKASVNKRSVYGSLLFKTPLDSKYNLKFGLGLSRHMPVVKTLVLNKVHRKSHYKVIPRICASIGYSLADDLETRLGLVWEKSSMLKKSSDHLKHDNFHINLGLSHKL